jgi:hypothetical protein
MAICSLMPPFDYQHIPSVLGETRRLLRFLDKYPARNFFFDANDAVYETRISFGGTSYITGLYNNQVDGANQVKESGQECIYFLLWFDDLGVTAIEFLAAQDRMPQQERPGQWASAVKLGQKTVRVQFKGIFIQDVVNDTPDQRIFWDSLKSPFLRGNKSIRTAPPNRSVINLNIPTPYIGQFLRYVPIQNATSLFALVHFDQIKSIHADSVGSPNRARCVNDPRGVWICLPLAQGKEIVVKAWVLEFRRSWVGQPTLIVSMLRPY